jgi:hypothetical protein
MSTSKPQATKHPIPQLFEKIILVKLVALIMLDMPTKFQGNPKK